MSGDSRVIGGNRWVHVRERVRRQGLGKALRRVSRGRHDAALSVPGVTVIDGRRFAAQGADR